MLKIIKIVETQKRKIFIKVFLKMKELKINKSFFKLTMLKIIKIVETQKKNYL